MAFLWFSCTIIKCIESLQYVFLKAGAQKCVTGGGTVRSGGLTGDAGGKRGQEGMQLEPAPCR